MLSDILDDGYVDERDGLENMWPLRQSLRTILVVQYGLYRDDWRIFVDVCKTLEKDCERSQASVQVIIRRVSDVVIEHPNFVGWESFYRLCSCSQYNEHEFRDRHRAALRIHDPQDHGRNFEAGSEKPCSNIVPTQTGSIVS